VGIRVHKVLGYGIKDLTGINDPRINQTALEDIYNRTKEDFIKFLKKQKKSGVLGKSTKSKWNPNIFEIDITISFLEKSDWEPCDSVAYDSEGKLSTIVFIPPSCYEEWFRYDDMIDYVENMLVLKKPRTSAKIINKPLYPYLSWMDKNTGLPLNTEEKDAAFIVARFSDKNMAFEDKLWSEVADKMVPMVPLCVRQYLEFAGIFSLDHIKDLRPILYTYWR